MHKRQQKAEAEKKAMLAAVSIRFVHLGIEIENLGKNISVFGFEIAYYGIVIALGMLLAITLVFHEAKITGQNLDHYYDLSIFIIIFGILGARIYYVIFEWSDYQNNLRQILNIRNGGLAIYGGIIAGILTAFIYSKIKKISFPQVLDTSVLGLVVGQIMGRWGNFFNREAYGGYTDNLFAMQIRLEEAAGVVTKELQEHIKIVDGIEYIQVHPTFLYEAMWNAAVLAGLLVYKKHKKFHGEIMCLYLVFYGIGRFMIESLRTDQLKLPVVHVAVSQVVSVVAVLLGMGVIVYQRVNKSRNDRLSEESSDSIGK